MRKSITAALVAAAVTGGVALGVSVTANAADAHPSDRTFTVVERALTDTVADTGPGGDSLGDVLAFANPIYNGANMVLLGSDNGSCVRTAVAKAYQWEWTTTLAGGSLVVSGPFYDTRDSVLAIVGGTGKWADARGQMRLHARDALGSSYDFTFDIRH